MNSQPTVLIIPGLWNSGPEHWQTLWQQAHPEYIRVEQQNWETPNCADWIATIDEYVQRVAGPVVLVGHSLGCATIAAWARAYGRKIHGALLVGPSDVDAPAYPSGTTGFNPMPLEPLPFPSIVVASEDDVYVSFERARQFAVAWGAKLVNVGNAGHINSASGLGDWPAGQALLAELLQS